MDETPTQGNEAQSMKWYSIKNWSAIAVMWYRQPGFKSSFRMIFKNKMDSKLSQQSCHFMAIWCAFLSDRGLELVLFHCVQPEARLSGSKPKSGYTMAMCQEAWECHASRAEVGKKDGKLGTVWLYHPAPPSCHLTLCLKIRGNASRAVALSQLYSLAPQTRMEATLC